MLCVEAWFELSADRALGYGVQGDIPTRAIRGWCRDEGLDKESARLLRGVIRFLDGERAARIASKQRLEDS